jgi:hypothetical protein
VEYSIRGSSLQAQPHVITSKPVLSEVEMLSEVCCSALEKLQHYSFLFLSFFGGQGRQSSQKKHFIYYLA